MQDDNLDNLDERWDRAVAGRLGRLRGAAVDTSAIEQALKGEMRWRELRLRIWLRPMRIAAAALLAIGLLAAVLIWMDHSSTVRAEEMANVHYQLVAGKASSMAVDSIEEANRMLQATATEGLGFPVVPAAHIHDCCVKDIQGVKIACVLMKTQGEYVTMAVANTTRVKMPAGKTVEKDGLTFHVVRSGKVNMVTLDRFGRHICLMSELPAEDLMEIGSRLRL